MNWHYRPIKKIMKDGEVYWGVVEWYGKKYGMTPPVCPYGLTKEELIKDLENMLKDVKTRKTIVRRE